MLNSPFGLRLHPVTLEKGKFHFGIDLHARSDSVFSILSGRIAVISYNSIIGVYLVIDHGRFSSIYGHLSRIFVPLASEVSPGETIALSGSTGRVTGEHLHFGIRENGHFIEPLRFIFLISRLDSLQLAEYLKE